MQKNQLTYFSKNPKLLKSTYGARRTVMLKYLDVRGGGSLPIAPKLSYSTSFGDSQLPEPPAMTLKKQHVVLKYAIMIIRLYFF